MMSAKRPQWNTLMESRAPIAAADMGTGWACSGTIAALMMV